jgi:23S rRNA (adenine2503-C2)-methyltransferase
MSSKMTQTSKTDIKDFTREALTTWLRKREIAPYRAAQIFKWVYVRQTDSFDLMSDLGKDIRLMLSEHFIIARLKKTRVETSQDGSRKYLFQLADGKYIESVLIPEKDHYTLCISTQVGCAQGCAFCMTAKGGFSRNLTSGEIIAQVRDIQNEIPLGPPLQKGEALSVLSRAPFSKGGQGGFDAPLTNIVFMGMGEPLANYSNVIAAVNMITDGDFGLKISSRRVTVSTAGLAPCLSDLGRDSDVNLAVSLNAADNETRNLLMPVNRKYPLETLLEACKTFRLKPRRRITFEYILIKGVNDSAKQAKKLAEILRPVKAKINLIPFNEHKGSEFLRPEPSVILQFQEILKKQNYTVMIRESKGQDISAACGQLSANV